MENNKRKELKVSALENGTVIDHIPSKSVFTVIRILGLEHSENPMTFGTNLESKKYGTKGIIKVSNKFFEEDEMRKIAFAAPNATLIEIKDFQVVAKRQVELPDEVVGIVRCFNPKCITNHQKVTQKFDVLDKEDLRLHCHYCEKITKKENMEFL